jgi:hypothetical protein
MQHNPQHPSILLHIPDKGMDNTLLLLILERKRDVIYRQTNLPLLHTKKFPPPPGLAAHITSILRRLHSYLQYTGLIKYVKSMETLHQLQEINLA